MSAEAVRAFLAARAPDLKILETSGSGETWTLASLAADNEASCFARTLLLSVGGRKILIVARRDTRLANQKIKSVFGHRAKMLGATEVQSFTGHPVNGVCPFGLARPVPVYTDISLQVFDGVLIAAGSSSAVVRIAPLRLADLTGAKWVDVCQQSD